MTDRTISEAQAVYLRLKKVFTGKTWRPRRRRTAKDATSQPFSSGRDPLTAGGAVDGLVTELGWHSALAQGDVLASWAEVVGEATAQHCEPIGLREGALIVRCSSTAWATQLRLMRDELLARLADEFADAHIETIRFQGPDAPSWKHGHRRTIGRGPRDTYG